MRADPVREELHELLDNALRQVVELFGGDQGAIYLLGRDTDLLTRAAVFGARSEQTHYFPPTPFPKDLLEHIRADISGLQERLCRASLNIEGG